MSAGDLIGRMRSDGNSRTAGPPNRSQTGTPSLRAMQVVQRAIDAGLRLVVAHHGFVEIVQDAGDLARVAADEALAEAVERALHRLMRRAIVIHRGGVAVSDRAVLGRGC